jgi:hypothetical protein
MSMFVQRGGRAVVRRQSMDAVWPLQFSDRDGSPQGGDAQRLRAKHDSPGLQGIAGKAVQ